MSGILKKQNGFFISGFFHSYALLLSGTVTNLSSHVPLKLYRTGRGPVTHKVRDKVTIRLLS